MEAKCLCSAMINNLPTPIIETILSLLPFKEAARTSILSREWKYHWTRIPKLEFGTSGVKVSSNDDELKERLSQANRKLLYAINQVMSMHQGPINEFSLSTYARGTCPCVEIDHIIDNLSRNYTIKKLTLDIFGYSLPASFFSLHKLTDLYLHYCRLEVQPTFSGFGSLANLCMENIITTKKMLLLFLSRCPLLKTVILNPNFGSLPDIDDSTDMDDSTVIELLECLPVVENLSIRISMMQYFDQGRVPNKLPAALVYLKFLCIRDACCAYRYRIPFYVFMIRSCPNLEKLKMKIIYDLSFGEAYSVIWDRYSDLWLEHLNELEIEVLIPRMFRLDFLKLILAKSPGLKTVKISVCMKLSKDEELKIIGKFLRCPRVSKVVEIVVESGVRFDRRPFVCGL